MCTCFQGCENTIITTLNFSQIHITMHFLANQTGWFHGNLKAIINFWLVEVLLSNSFCRCWLLVWCFSHSLPVTWPHCCMCCSKKSPKHGEFPRCPVAKFKAKECETRSLNLKMLLSTGNILMVGWLFFFHHIGTTANVQDLGQFFFAPLLKSYSEKLWCNCCIQHMQFFFFFFNGTCT